MFRNPEVRHFFLVYMLFSVICAGAAFAIHPMAGVLSCVCTVLSGALFFQFTRRRYLDIAQLSYEIDLVLHNMDRLCIEEAKEGELSILRSEITKMTLRIREQNEALKREKEYLADSLADIAHQLRTPLTSAHLLLSLLEDSPQEGRRRELLREAKGLFAQMDWLLEGLLKLSRLDAGIVVFGQEDIEVAALVEAAAQPLRIPMELHGIELRILAPEGMQIRGDAGWTAEAVRNILKNCMESVGSGGFIEICCQDTALFAEIAIHDSGRGFRQEELPGLFDRFCRGKNAPAGGYGIGLALCKTILTRQGGTVTARNHPQGGALFTIRFPR